jgi:hypothetical protein
MILVVCPQVVGSNGKQTYRRGVEIFFISSHF